ncbi:MAG: transglutaminase family protein [Verrucomicrobiaceae bacterium]|nr:transglutaminase family protein [Verrucomicrobiaceae bacterium]
MPDAQLSHLIRLLDDESEVVREAVKRQIESMKKDLPDRLTLLDRPLTPEEDRILGELLAPSRREDLEDNWMLWREQATAEAQIEWALAQLSAFLSGWKSRPRELTSRLDVMAGMARESIGSAQINARELADWLFAGRNEGARLRGNSKDYYSPHNSNLLWVLDMGLGNPISLCMVYRLLGARLGITVEGCNFPGHFLARVVHDDDVWLVDCFNRGRFMLAADVARHHPAANPAMEELVHQTASTESILLRFLRNLDDAFDKMGQMPERQLMRRLGVKMMEG